MDIKHPRYPGLVDYFPVQSHRELQAKTRHRLAICFKPIVHHAKHAAHPRKRLARCRRGKWMVAVHSNATSFLRCGGKLGAIPGHTQSVDGYFPGLAMDLQIKPVFEQHLHHGSPHHFVAWSSLGLRLDPVEIVQAWNVTHYERRIAGLKIERGVTILIVEGSGAVIVVHDSLFDFDATGGAIKFCSNGSPEEGTTLPERRAPTAARIAKQAAEISDRGERRTPRLPAQRLELRWQIVETG